ncbi:MAG: hypothetical protein H0U74_10955 [Bradymonadaceae bacterium]|nr:hypothetical protein [Lujinxingiaceae bacterium]
MLLSLAMFAGACGSDNDEQDDPQDVGGILDFQIERLDAPEPIDFNAEDIAQIHWSGDARFPINAALSVIDCGVEECTTNDIVYIDEVNPLVIFHWCTCGEVQCESGVTRFSVVLTDASGQSTEAEEYDVECVQP